MGSGTDFLCEIPAENVAAKIGTRPPDRGGRTGDDAQILGATGIEVHAIGLGAMPLSIQGRPDERVGLEVIAAFLDGGGNFIDTAISYCLDNATSATTNG